MSSLKPLKSIAHNVAHHFASTLSYWKDDYTINHVWNAARADDINHVKIDVLRRKIEPEVLYKGRVREILPSVFQFLEYLMKTEGMGNIELEEMTLEYNFGVNRISLHDLPTYNCISTIKTMSGRRYEVKLTEENN